MLPLPDLAIVVAIALGSALATGLVGLGLLRLTRRASMLVQLCVVAATAIVSVVVGMLAVGQAMYVSPEDLVVSFYVAAVAALVSVAVAVLLGRSFTRNSNRLRSMTQALGDGERIAIGANTVGVAAGGFVAWRFRSVIGCVVVAAVVTALLRTI